MMKTIVFGGHNSKFGFACIEELLKSDFFNIDTIILGDFQRWNEFTTKLKGLKNTSYNRSLRKRNKQQISRLKKIIKRYSNSKLEIIYNANSEIIINDLKNYDIVFCAAFPQIFNSTFIKAANERVVNFHPSFLPRCRGANPIYWTIMTNENFGGLTAHFIERKIDRGPIIAQEKILFNRNEITYSSLYQLVLDNVPKVIKNVEDFFKENKVAIKQDESEASYFRNDRLIHYKVFWGKDSNELISAKIRAGGAFTFRNGKQINLNLPFNFMEKTKYVTNNYENRIPPGTIVFILDKQIWVKSTNGYLKVNYSYEKDLLDKIISLFLFLKLGFLIYRLPLLNQHRLKLGETLS